MRIKLAIMATMLSCAICQAQYYSIDIDTQRPTEDYIIDSVFSGNTPYLRAYVYENGTALDLTPWTMEFVYSYGQYDTNGVVQIAGTVSDTNCVSFLGATNVFFQAFDKYYFSIKGTHSSGYIKTFATGRMIQRYDPATATNLPSLMGQLNMDWWTNNVGAQVESNLVQIAILVTGKVDQTDFDATNLVFEGRIGSNEADIVELVNTNTGFEVRIASNETFRITTQPATNLLLQGQITTNLANQEATNAAFEVRIASNDTFRADQVNTNSGYETRLASLESGSTTTNLFDELTVANVDLVDTNICTLTNTVYTGSVDSVAYTGTTPTVVGKVYTWGFYKANSYGTGTLTLAGATLTVTNSGLTSNHMTAVSTDTNIVLTIDGTGTEMSNVSNVFVRLVTNGNLAVADRLDVGGSVWVNGQQSVFDASSNGVAYVRKNASWVAGSNEFVATNNATYTATVALAAAAYPASNPSNFIDATAGEPLWVAVSNAVVYTNDSTYTTAVGQAAAAYPASNPSNFVTAASLTVSRYWANTNDGESVQVLATSTNITVSRTNSTWYFNIPAGTRIFSHTMRVDGDNTDSGKVYLYMGTNDMDNSTAALGTIPHGLTCYREDTLSTIYLTAKPKSGDATLIEISGMGTGAGTIYNAAMGW